MGRQGIFYIMGALGNPTFSISVLAPFAQVNQFLLWLFSSQPNPVLWVGIQDA